MPMAVMLVQFADETGPTPRVVRTEQSPLRAGQAIDVLVDDTRQHWLYTRIRSIASDVVNADGVAEASATLIPRGFPCAWCREPVATIETTFPLATVMNCPACGHRWLAEPLERAV